MRMQVLMILPWIFTVGSVAVLVVVVRYFVTLGRNVEAIKKLMEERKAQGK